MLTTALPPVIDGAWVQGKGSHDGLFGAAISQQADHPGQELVVVA